MAKICCGWYWRLGLVSLVTVGGAIIFSGRYAWSQVTSDNTLGAESAQVTSTNPGNFQIDGGAMRGTNLFHSFSQFSVPTGSLVFFNNALNIQNIMSRVTASSVSSIDGLIRANGTANLFLINPNGIVFGPNASLNVGGSFLASTASSINFADGDQFSATAPQTTSLLTISVPFGLQFGSNAGSILVQGIRTTTDLIDTTAGLRVQPDQTLALVGGEVALDGGTLKTAGGRIELGSVASPSLISLTPIGKGWALDYASVSTFGNIHLAGTAAVDASGVGSGDIQVYGRQLTLTDGSGIESSTLGSESGGTLAVTASEAVELIGRSADGLFVSSISARVGPRARGTGGNLTIETKKLIVRDGAVVVTGTYGPGAGGDLTVRASESVELIGTTANGQLVGGLSTQVFRGATGTGGSLTIDTERLIVRDGAQVSAGTFGEGPSGSLLVKASELVELIGTTADGLFPSGLSTSAEPGATGAGGNLTVETERLIARNGAAVSTGTYGQGVGGSLAVRASESVELIGTTANGQQPSILSSSVGALEATGAGGDLTIDTERLIVRDGAQAVAGTLGKGPAGNLLVKASESVELIERAASAEVSSGLFSQVFPKAMGAGGNLTIETGRLIVQNGAVVSSDTFGSGPGKPLVVRASESVEVTGRSANGQRPSILSSSAGGEGAGANLTIATGRLIVRDGSQIVSGTFNEGKAGTLSVTASESVEISGTSTDVRIVSGLFTQTQGAGDAGDLRIETGQLNIRDGAGVSVSNLGSGIAGNLQVQARSIHLDNRARLRAITGPGNGGDINLQAQDLLLRRESNISTRAGTEQTSGNGGRITIDTNNLVALENSDIDANAFGGSGGQVIINAQGIFGTEGRELQTPESDITASSSLGVEFSGTIQLNTPDVELNRALVTLPTILIDPNRLISNSCIARSSRQGGSFTITGAGGLPTRPGDAAVSPYSTGTVRSIPNNDALSTSPQSSLVLSTNKARPWKLGDSIVEPQGVYRLANGELVLSRECSQ